MDQNLLFHYKSVYLLHVLLKNFAIKCWELDTVVCWLVFDQTLNSIFMYMLKQMLEPEMNTLNFHFRGTGTCISLQQKKVMKNVDIKYQNI